MLSNNTLIACREGASRDHRFGRALSIVIIGLVGHETLLAAPIAISGTSVSLEAPAGFVVATEFAGLKSIEDQRSSITISEFPAEAHQQVAVTFTSVDAAAKGLSASGITVLRRKVLDVNGKPVPLLEGEQTAGAVVVTKYIALLEGAQTVVMTFNLFGNVMSQEQVEATIASVRLAGPPTLAQQLAALPFSFEAVAPFHVVNTLGGSGVTLAISEEQDATGMAPLVVIAQALAGLDPSSASAPIAERQLRGTTGFEQSEIVAAGPADFVGGAGRFLEAKVEGRTAIQYLFIPPDGRYVRLVAMGETGALAALKPVIEQIAHSVAVR